MEKRIGFVVEVAKEVTAAIGGERVGIRLSPYGVNAGMKAYPEIDETYQALVARISLRTACSTSTSSITPPWARPRCRSGSSTLLRRAWPRTLILAGGLTDSLAEAALRDGKGDLFAFGRAFLANPDLVLRLEGNLPLNSPDGSTFYTPGPKGYTDYPLVTALSLG